MNFACPAAAVGTVEETRLLAVDMGADWIKAATLDASLAPGRPAALSVNILLNDQTNRRSPPCVSFRCLRRSGEVTCERSFAEEAMNRQPRFPLQTVCGPAQLLGFTHDEALSAVVAAQAGENRSTFSLSQAEVDAEFPYHITTNDREGFSVVLPRDLMTPGDNMTFSVEEMVGMLLGHMNSLVRKADRERNRQLTDRDSEALSASTHREPATPVVRHAAITIPSHATVAERQAMVDAGSLSGLRVVRLVHSVTAAATALAYNKMEQILQENSTSPVSVLIMDIGSRQTEAAVFQFAKATAKSSAEGGSRRSPQAILTLLSTATNRTLGGKAFDRCIAQYWDSVFLEGSVMTPFAEGGPSGCTAQEKLDVGRRRAALLRAANQARERLSANRETPVTVEGVQIPGHSEAFTTTLSRETFEEVCKELFEAIVNVRDAAIARTQGRVASISRFEVVGGAARMPRVLEMVGRGYRDGVVDRTLNGDEAMAVGTAYLGGTASRMLPTQFLVREALTNSIGFLVTPPLPAGAEGEEWEDDYTAQSLFTAHHVNLPAAASVRLKDRTQDFIFTMAAPPAMVATATLEAQREQRSVVCPGCYVHHYRMQVSKAVKRALAVATVLTKGGTTMTFETSEVVVETAVSESGLPSITKAYLQVNFTKEVRQVIAPTPPPTANTTNSTSDLDEDASPDAATTEEDAKASDPLPEDDMATDADVAEESKPEEEEEQPADVTAAADNVTDTVEEEGEVNITVSEVTRIFPIYFHALAGRQKETMEDNRTVWLVRGVNPSPTSIRTSHDRLRHLDSVDTERYACSLLRNNLESDLIALRTSNAWDDELDITAELLTEKGVNITTDAERTDVLEWRTVVQELNDWLDDEGDSATKNALTERRKRVASVKKYVQAVLGEL